MLQVLDNYDGSPEARQAIRVEFDRRLQELLSSTRYLDRTLVQRCEQLVRREPAAAIRFSHDGFATIEGPDRTFQGGRFEVVSLRELRARAAVHPLPARPPRVALWILDGSSPITDIGALQATAGPGSLFQVASQFNCLESPGAHVTDIARYFFDPTQGPRASISAFPGTLVRHYAAPAPDGSRFVQRTDGQQLNLLAAITRTGSARVDCGYLRASGIRDPGAFVTALEAGNEDICVGVHDDVEVVLGANWDGPVDPDCHISQVFTSTLAGGGYGSIDVGMCRPLQRAAYTGTLLAAAAMGKRRAVLTLIGGGVFGNPIRVIWEAILQATDEVASLLHGDLAVIVNGRTLGESIPAGELASAARSRGGDYLRCDVTGVRQSRT